MRQERRRHEPAATDADEIYRNNRTATRTALENGAQRLPATADVIAAREAPSNPFYTPEV